MEDFTTLGIGSFVGVTEFVMLGLTTAVETAVTGTDLHYTIPAQSMHYSIPKQSMQYTVPNQ